MNRFIKLTLLSLNLLHAQFNMHVKVGLSSNRATVSGQLYTLAQEMDMYSAMYDGQNMSDVLNDVVIAPQKAIYVLSLIHI